MARKNVIRALAGTAGVLLVAGAAGPGAAAVTMEDSGDVQATVRKTVLQTATATGEILTSRMYTQVSAVGNGTKTVLVPVGATSNRNLNAFGPFPMEGESIQFDLTVDGGVEERTLTDADINPMEISVKVTLDGVEIQPEDVVGASGVLDVQYTVRNTTATTSPVTFADVEGTEITEDLETADPYVGSLDVTLPQGFNEVTAPGATIAGNGQNQTSLGYSFVLFPPLGSPEVTVGYQARIDGGVMPPADFSFLPIVPFDNGQIAGATDAYRGGAAVGAQIFGAGAEIGDNLLKLQDGASQLVSGLGQLAAGATQLSDGLVNTAAPGAAALADGSAQVSDGLNELNGQIPALEDGVSQLNAGAKQLNGGANQVADGNADLADGADELKKNVPALASGVSQLATGANDVEQGMKGLNAGLTTLYGSVDAMPDTVKEQLEAPGSPYLQVLGALDGVIQAIGDATTPGTLVNTASQVSGGLSSIRTNLQGLAGPGLLDCDEATCQYVTQNLAPGAPPTAASTAQILATIISSIGDGTPPDPDAPTAKPSLTYAMKRLTGGLSNDLCVKDKPQDPTNPCGVKQINEIVRASIPLLIDGILDGIRQTTLAGIGVPAPGCDPTKTLRCASAALGVGTTAVSDGLDSLNSKVPALSDGVNQLAAGANQLADGAAQVADGTGTLAAGTKALDAKVPALASGVGQLDAGAAQVAEGNQDLSDGLGAAADGSGQLVDGLAQAEPGGAQIEQGAGDLKEQGADVLAQTGKDAQIGYARDVALLEASQQAGLEGAGIPFGNAVGTDVITTAAVQMQLAGIAPDTTDTALKIGLGVLLIAGAGGAAFAATRRVAA